MANIVFSNINLSLHIERAKAELYMQLYPYAAEDFQTIPDAKIFANKVISWAVAIEEQQAKQGIELATHVHTITPHSHVIPKHEHTITPHTHPLDLTKNIALQNMQLQTSNNYLEYTETTLHVVSDVTVPLNANEILWIPDIIPTPPTNSTGAISNLDIFKGNRIIPKSIVAVGDIEIPVSRRAKMIEVLAIPDVPPLLVDAAAEGLG